MIKFVFISGLYEKDLCTIGKWHMENIRNHADHAPFNLVGESQFFIKKYSICLCK